MVEQEVRSSRPEALRLRAAQERRKLQDIDSILARLEARLADVAPGQARSSAGSGRDRRTHPRQNADLVIRYRWPGRHAPLVGRLRDVSRGGLRFSASRSLETGAVLQASIHSPGGAGAQFEGQMYLEVVYCRPSGELWDVGTRFAPMPAERFRETERRRSRRFPVRLDLAYRLSGEERLAPSLGLVRDISRSGLRFYGDRRLRTGALAAAVVTGAQARPSAGAGAGTRVRVSALVRVVRCRKVGARFEIGARFVG